MSKRIANIAERISLSSQTHCPYTIPPALPAFYLKQKEPKVVCYLSAEFLLRPRPGNGLINLGIYDQVRQAMCFLLCRFHIFQFALKRQDSDTDRPVAELSRSYRHNAALFRPIVENLLDHDDTNEN
jgi:hypothetical protein